MGCGGSKSGAAAAQPAAKPQPLEGDYKITLERTSDEQTLGLRVVDADSVLRVEGLKEEGLMPDFIKANENSPDQHVKKGDLIVAVNGISGGTDMVKDELKAKTIVLTIKRAPSEAAEEPAAAPAEAEAAPAADAADAAPAAEPAAEPEAKEESGEKKAEVPLETVEAVLAGSEGSAPVPEAAAVGEGQAEVEVVTVDAEEGMPAEINAEDAREARLCKMSMC